MNSDLLTKYINMWVALSMDRKSIIASAKNIESLDKKIKTLKKSSEVIYHHVLPINGNYAP